MTPAVRRHLVTSRVVEHPPRLAGRAAGRCPLASALLL